MARSLRFEVLDGWHHVTARGNERKPIFRDDADRHKFEELLEETSQRHGVVVAAYVLMPNHYHLVLRTPLANLSRAMQWFNAVYSGYFNRRYRRAGHLYQGRFKSVLVDEREWLVELVRYVHLNPVRVRRLGLGKTQRAEAERGTTLPPAAVVQQRLAMLRSFRWSSHRFYAGLASRPPWLEIDEVLTRMGGGSQKEREARYRDYATEALRGGLPESPWEKVLEGAVLGSREFVEGVKKRVLQALRGEKHRVQRMSRTRMSLEQVRRTVERIKGETWTQFAGRHGDSGRDMFLWLGRRHCGASLPELAAAVGGLSASAASEAIRRLQRRIPRNRVLSKTLTAARQMLKMET